MAHESFEDQAIAAVMNEHFVCVKVDREERPDVDAMCMEACQAMTGHGGWPLNAFLTPALVPFYAGTYFPPESRHGLPSWRMVLLAVADAWGTRREEISTRGREIIRSLGASARLEPSNEPIRVDLLDRSLASIRGAYDSSNGGFGTAPKFPQPSVIEYLLARGEREMSLGTADGDGAGRHLRPGRRWLCPLRGRRDAGPSPTSRRCSTTTPCLPAHTSMVGRSRATSGSDGSAARRSTGRCERCRVRRAASARRSTPTRTESRAGSTSGASTSCARRSATELADRAIAFFGATERGNFEAGSNVLEGRGAIPEGLPEIRCKLYGARAHRVRPGLDDKRLTGWNALMVSALAEAGAVLERGDYLDAATRCACFILEHLRDGEGRLLRTWKEGGHGSTGTSRTTLSCSRR